MHFGPSAAPRYSWVWKPGSVPLGDIVILRFRSITVFWV
jgi:hypothetical protein